MEWNTMEFLLYWNTQPGPSTHQEFYKTKGNTLQEQGSRCCPLNHVSDTGMKAIQERIVL